MTGAMAAVAIALQLVNVNTQGVQGDGHSIWADGRTVVFCTSAANFTRPFAGVGDWVYAWRRDSGNVTALANAGSCVRTADVSADGRTALFTADMPELVPEDVGDPRQSDAFVAPLPGA